MRTVALLRFLADSWLRARVTSHILRFGAYATDELHIPPDVFDPALDEVDFGGEQPAAA
jgi:hypothetical protein